MLFVFGVSTGFQGSCDLLFVIVIFINVYILRYEIFDNAIKLNGNYFLLTH